jgi:integrase
MAKRWLTQGYFDGLSLPKGEADRTYYDDKVPGLGLRFRAEGKPKWTLYYQRSGKQRRYVIGPRSVKLEAAREAAQQLQGEVAKGLDIAEARRDERKQVAAERTFESLAEDYLEVLRGRIAAGELKPRSYVEIERHLLKHLKPLHRLVLSSITRATIASRLREIAKQNGPGAADRTRSNVSTFFGWAIGEGICETNPVDGTNRQAEPVERERSLILDGEKPNYDEIVAVWKGAPDSEYGKIVRLLILTLCRRDEIGSLGWSEIDREGRLIRLPGPRTKNGREHVVPLSDAAMAILDTIDVREGREFVFGSGKGGYSGWSKSKSKGVKLKKPWTLHDLRRTGRTGLGILGVAPHIAEAVLNHLPPKLVRTYDRNAYEREKRAALDLWAEQLMRLVNGEKSNVVPLRA